MGDYREGPDLAHEIKRLDRRIDALERSRQIPVGSGAPPSAQVDGSLYGDKAGLFLYVVLNGTARKVAVA